MDERFIFLIFDFFVGRVRGGEMKLKRERDNVVYWKTNGKINNDLQ